MCIRDRFVKEVIMTYIKEIDKWLNKKEDYILSFLSGLISTNTVNLPPGGNEKQGQEYIYNKISKIFPEKDIDLFDIDEVRGIRENPFFFPTIDGVPKNYKDRPNLVAKLEGRGGGRNLAFSGHIDTMPDYGKKWTVFEDPYLSLIHIYLAERGKIFIIISSDNQELANISDRVGIMKDKSMIKILEGNEVTEENILKYSL